MSSRNTKEHNDRYYKRNRKRLLDHKKADRLTRPEIYWEKELKRDFGITVRQYKVMFETQGGVCALCGHPPKTRRLAVDHDHRTGRVRALLCGMCNHYKMGTNNLQSAKHIVEILQSDFDGRLI